MRRSILQLCLLASVAAATSGCSWSRFDDITDGAPIVLFEKPGSMKEGFGDNVTTVTKDSETSVLIGGAVGVSGAALFTMGEDGVFGTTSVDSGYCTGGTADCYLSSSLGAFPTATADEVRPLCYAVGTGAVSKAGLIIRCRDATEYTLDMPSAAQKLIAFSLEQHQPYDYPMATDRTDEPVLLVTLPYNQTAWFYPAKSTKFSSLSAPSRTLTDDKSFGSTLAVLPVGDGRVLAIGVPGKNEVLLWKTDGGAASSYIGCLGGTPGFGRALTAGPVNRDAAADLVVSDSTNVHVIDGQALFDLPETDSAECGFGSLPAGALLGSFGCGSNTSLTGCADSQFGAALAVGDLDGDGDGEVVVGAPLMTARDEGGAGAVLVYDVESPTDATFVDAKFLSSAEGGDHLGASLATPHIPTTSGAKARDLIVAGAPGTGKAALFYCSPLLKSGEAGPRCP